MTLCHLHLEFLDGIVLKLLNGAASQTDEVIVVPIIVGQLIACQAIAKLPLPVASVG